MNTLIKTLIAELGETAVITAASNADLQPYCQDWSGAAGQAPVAVLLPATTEQVAAALRACHAAKQPVVVQGGLTGLAGGACPQQQEIAISLQRLAGIEELDTQSMTLTALAGTPLQTLQQAAADAGLYLPLDLGARGSCTIGGNVATNAGGNQVIRYGMTRALVLGLEAVLPDGTVISTMNKMLKNNTGFDLKQLFIGSEGTLGLVTKVVLRLFPGLNNSQTALCALPDFASTLALFQQLNKALPGGLSSFEAMWSNYFNAVVNNVEQARNPFAQPYPLYALVEYRSSTDNTAASTAQQVFEQALYSVLEQGLAQDILVAQSLKDAEAFWRIRDGIAELLPLLGPVAVVDISVPLNVMDDFVTVLEKRVKEAFPNVQLLVFGHIGDSNLHLCVGTGKPQDVPAISSLIMQLTGDYGGAVSAEHGIGIIKKDYLRYSRTPAELALMRTLKRTLDPNGILNPGRVIDV